MNAYTGRCRAVERVEAKLFEDELIHPFLHVVRPYDAGLAPLRRWGGRGCVLACSSGRFIIGSVNNRHVSCTLTCLACMNNGANVRRD